MITEYGTCHFGTKRDAIRYYKRQGECKTDVEYKIKEGSIKIGKPLTPMGKKAVLIPDEGRWAIRDLRFDELEKIAEFVVDDTGNGRRIGEGQHAIVRRAGVDDFCNRSAFAVFDVQNIKVVVAVNSYLDCWMSDEEVAEIASDWMNEKFFAVSEPVICRG